jgi:ribosomal-protein-alanine N-acetyltransferase
MKLGTKRLILRELKKTDARAIQKNADNLEIARVIPLFPHPYYLKDARDFIKSCIKKSKQKPRREFDFGITLRTGEEVMGMISIVSINRFNGSATIGYWLGSDYWRNGYMEEALRRMVDFGFRTLRLRRINIDAFADNVASNSLIRKVGFIYEGRRIEELKDKATKRIHDHDFYGMLRKNWLKKSRPR